MLYYSAHVHKFEDVGIYEECMGVILKDVSLVVGGRMCETT